MSCLVLFCSCVFFSLLSIAITSLGEERANLSAFRKYELALVWFCLFPLPLGGKDCSLLLWHSFVTHLSKFLYNTCLNYGDSSVLRFMAMH